MNILVDFMQKLAQIWLDSGVFIPALLVGYCFANRNLAAFGIIAAIMAVLDHVLVVLLFKFKNPGISQDLGSVLASNVVERVAAFLIATLVMYGLARLFRKSEK